MNFYSGIQKSFRVPTYKTAKRLCQELTQIPHLAVIGVTRKAFIFVYEKNAFLSSWYVGGFLLVGWGC